MSGVSEASRSVEAAGGVEACRLTLGRPVHREREREREIGRLSLCHRSSHQIFPLKHVTPSCAPSVIHRSSHVARRLHIAQLWSPAFTFTCDAQRAFGLQVTIGVLCHLSRRPRRRPLLPLPRPRVLSKPVGAQYRNVEDSSWRSGSGIRAAAPDGGKPCAGSSCGQRSRTACRVATVAVALPAQAVLSAGALVGRWCPVAPDPWQYDLLVPLRGDHRAQVHL